LPKLSGVAILAALSMAGSLRAIIYPNFIRS
jgi:hypothetical protein